MADAATAGVEATERREVLHEPFEWYPDVPPDAPAWASQITGLAARTRDVAAGVATVLEILESDELNSALADADMKPLPRLVSKHAAGNLIRLCITSLVMLRDDAEGVGDSAHKRATAARAG